MKICKKEENSIKLDNKKKSEKKKKSFEQQKRKVGIGLVFYSFIMESSLFLFAQLEIAQLLKFLKVLRKLSSWKIGFHF